jgi:hypothetical protein
LTSKGSPCSLPGAAAGSRRSLLEDVRSMEGLGLRSRPTEDDLEGLAYDRHASCVFRKSVTGHFGIVTGDFGNVTGHFGDVTDRLSAVF